MLKRMLGLIGVMLLAGGGALRAGPPEISPPAVSSAQGVRTAPAARAPIALPASRALLDEYCVVCHNDRLKTGNLVLEDKDLAQVGADAEFWEKVVRKLRGGTMPPVGRPRPDRVTYHGLIRSLEEALDQAALEAPDPGRPLIHRLNRTEYTNAVRDLLSLEIDGPSFLPPDTSGFGFDNVADVLSMSPALLDRYMAAARRISRAAVGDPTLRTDLKRYTISRLLLQEDRESATQSFGTRGGITVRHHFPLDGEYLFRVDFQLSYNQRRVDVRGRHEDNQIDVRVDGKRVKSFVVERSVQDPTPESRYGGSEEALYPLEVRVPVTAGTHEVSVALVKQIAAAPEGVGPSRLPQATSSYWWRNVPAQETGKFEMGLTFLEIQGPFDGTLPDDTPSRRRIFVCHPANASEELPCARQILSTLARRAYRRPATGGEVDTLLGFYQIGQGAAGFDRGIQYALERVLVAPQFLLRVEADPNGEEIHRISDLELASRLSFFLWSSIPDDELLDLAERGRLTDPAVREQQVRRMLADPKSAAMLTNFFGQWLWLRNMATVTPDVDLFPGFDDTLRAALQRETELFIASQVREDHSVLELLTADYTFVNERLARHYGIPSVYGAHFRRVALPDGARAGLLGQGSILTVTSYSNRTSPVVRAKWLLENLLGTPPPEPPPNVPLLEDDEKGQAPRSMRVKMERHRANPVCASCHSMLDPLGFAFENFDAVGRYRATEGDGVTPIDASGALPSGESFDGPAAFRAALLEQRETFVTTLTQKMLTYALGRGAEYYDMPAVRRIVHEAAVNDYRWSSIILGIVDSLPFQMRRSES